MTKKSIKILKELHSWYKHYSIDNSMTLEDAIEKALNKFKENNDGKAKR